MPNNKQDNFHFVDFVSYPEVQTYLGVKKQEFLVCNTTFAHQFWPGDTYEDSSPMIAHFLEKNIKVLMFSGDQDFLVNYEYEERVIGDLEWAGKNLWKNTPLQDCEQGLCKDVLNLRYVRVKGAGHVPPNYQQQLCFDMIN